MTGTQVMLLALASYTAVAANIDYRTGHIPNPLILVGLFAGLGLQIACVTLGFHWPVAPTLQSIPSSILLGVLVCGALPLLLFRLDAMGGGDVKLLVVVGLWLGPIWGLKVELYAFGSAALYAIALWIYRGQLGICLVQSARLVISPKRARHKARALAPGLLTSVRFGPAVFLGAALLTLVHWRLV